MKRKRRGDRVSGGWYKAMGIVKVVPPTIPSALLSKIKKSTRNLLNRGFTCRRMVPPPFCKQKRGIVFALLGLIVYLKSAPLTHCARGVVYKVILFINQGNLLISLNGWGDEACEEPLLQSDEYAHE